MDTIENKGKLHSRMNGESQIVDKIYDLLKGALVQKDSQPTFVKGEDIINEVASIFQTGTFDCRHPLDIAFTKIEALKETIKEINIQGSDPVNQYVIAAFGNRRVDAFSKKSLADIYGLIDDIFKFHLPNGAFSKCDDSVNELVKENFNSQFRTNPFHSKTDFIKLLEELVGSNQIVKSSKPLPEETPSDPEINKSQAGIIADSKIQTNAESKNQQLPDQPQDENKISEKTSNKKEEGENKHHGKLAKYLAKLWDNDENRFLGLLEKFRKNAKTHNTPDISTNSAGFSLNENNEDELKDHEKLASHLTEIYKKDEVEFGELLLETKKNTKNIFLTDYRYGKKEKK